MLSLTQYPGQQTIIVVPPSTTQTVIMHETVSVRGHGVINGYDAPKEVGIWRMDVYRRISAGETRVKAVRA